MAASRRGAWARRRAPRIVPGRSSGGVAMGRRRAHTGRAHTGHGRRLSNAGACTGHRTRAHAWARARRGHAGGRHRHAGSGGLFRLRLRSAARCGLVLVADGRFAVGGRLSAPCGLRVVCQDCREFKNGNCSRGESCRFNHVGGPPPAAEGGGFDDSRFDDDDDNDDRRGGRADRYDEEDRRYDDEEVDYEEVRRGRGGPPTRRSNACCAHSEGVMSSHYVCSCAREDPTMRDHTVPPVVRRLLRMPRARTLMPRHPPSRSAAKTDARRRERRQGHVSCAERGRCCRRPMRPR